MDHRCPHCAASLQHERMPEQEAPRHSRRQPRRFFKVCPHCQGRVQEMRHPALAGDWLWMKFTMPGMVLSVLAIFAWPPLVWVAVPALVAGIAATVVYSVRERMRWVRFRVFDADGAD